MPRSRPRPEPRRSGTHCRGLLAAALLLLAVSPQALAQGREAQLEELLVRLAERAEVYERTALRFSCREEARVTKYSGDETPKKIEVDDHDYLLENTEKGGLSPYRALLSRNGDETRRREVDPDYPVPEPYAWQLLFRRQRGEVFHFDLVGPEFDPPDLTWVIEFKTLLSYSDGRTIDQWDGVAWVDQDTLDILRVEATPANQAATLEAVAAEYRQSFRVLGMGTKKRPKERRLKVEFGIRREELRFPSRVFFSVRLLDSLAQNGKLKESVALAYDSYVFYGVDTQEEFEKLRGETPAEP
jgi:hypothetical protein